MKLKTIKECVEQIAKCGFVSEKGDPINLNIGFERLVGISKGEYQPKFQINEKVIFGGHEYYVRGYIARSVSHPDYCIDYFLSKEYNRPSTSNQTVCSWIEEEKLCSIDEWEQRQIEEAKQLLKSKGIIE